MAFNFKLEGDLILDEVELTKKKFFQADYTQINDNFKLNNWSVAMLERDLQDKWDFLLHSYINIIDELVPVGPLLGGGQFFSKWMTLYAKQTITRKVNAWNLHRLKHTKGSYKNYKSLRNISLKAVRQAKWKYEKSVAEAVQRGDTAVFYSYARSLTTIKDDVASVTTSDGSLSRSKKESADTINATFQSVFVREGDGPIPLPAFQFNGVFLEDFEFTEFDVYNILIHLKESSAPGPDTIHPKVLK